MEFLTNNFSWLLILVLLLNMSQRKIPQTDRKRQSTIYIAVILMVFYLAITIVSSRNLPWWILIIVAVVLVIAAYIFRSRVWPFTLHCRDCGAKLKYEYIIGHDDCLCQDCHDKRHPEEAEARRKKEEEAERRARNEVVDQNEFASKTSVEEIDWDLWEPTDRCVITYTEMDGKLLLIHKKRGLGEGYYNAPGGHIEEAETSAEAAIRETKEETGLDIHDPEYRGTLRFQFDDGIREIGYVFFSYGAEGELRESDETVPFWCDKDKIPFDNMWEDDPLWLPGALEGRKFDAYFIFAGKKMIDHKVVWKDEEAEVLE